jgi:selenocysteine-specific elongation factor
MPTTSSGHRSHFVICLAGHIDHGKSALVQALTGANVDRLPEEKRRGITIELGFSHFETDGCRLALIDVPGHERLVHTMVAGASGVDAALLVVAADDSVMPQTREHLALLQLLGIQQGVIALTKCDLADAEQLELVQMEIAELVAGTFLERAPRLQVSAKKNQGIAELRAALVQAARSSPSRPVDDSRFRLSIDRAFSPSGQGTVVTGTVLRGKVSAGETLQLLPAETPVRIRRLQSQGADVPSVVAGDRAAINLVGVKVGEIRRGDELATPDAFQPGRRHLVELQILADAESPLKHRQAVRLHLGANQVTATVLMQQKEVAPGEATFAVLRCNTPIVAEYGQAFVIRQLSPVRTVGGGRFLIPSLGAEARLNRSLAAAPELASADHSTRLQGYVVLCREVPLNAIGEFTIGMTRAECNAAAARLIRQKSVVSTAGSQPILVSAAHFEQLAQRLVRGCRAELERRRPAPQVLLSAVLAAMSPHASPAVLEAVVQALCARGELVRRGELVGLATGPALTNRQRALLKTVLEQITAAGPTPPTLKELAEQHQCVLKDLELLLQVAVDQGELVRVSPQLAIHHASLDTLRQSLQEMFQRQPTGTVSEIREQWQMTRKHAVPILEYFDQCQITARSGDSRSAGPKIALECERVLT